MKIVVTGNIGCGKSTAVKLLHDFLPDYEVFDYDAEVHALYQYNIVQMVLYDTFQTSNRAKISDIVFRDAEKRKRLNEIIGTYMLMKIEEALKFENIIFDIPLYFEHIEKHIGDSIDKVLCISADEITQVERVKRRNGWTEEKVQAVIASQLPQTEKEQRSDYYIENTLTVDDLKNRIEVFCILNQPKLKNENCGNGRIV